MLSDGEIWTMGGFVETDDVLQVEVKLLFRFKRLGRAKKRKVLENVLAAAGPVVKLIGVVAGLISLGPELVSTTHRERGVPPEVDR